MAENRSVTAAAAVPVRTHARTFTPAYQAYQILHVAFTVAPLVAGADKFFHFMVNWDQYLSPLVTRTLPISAHTFMQAVGIIEIVAALLVALMPAIGGWIVGLWLLGIVVNLLTIPAYFDIALRDFGLALGAFALARLAAEFDRH
ncbi:MAG TPA: hypothetical protein VFP91_01455 [Vicinamibacterales bacterium]|jgi:hypothetical protein|nr:hypothetical protein [Vicinamibacterales bacterium]